MEIINFFTDQSAWERDELFYPLRRFFGPYEKNPFNEKPYVEIKEAFLREIYADKYPSFDASLFETLSNLLTLEAKRFEDDFKRLLPTGFKVLIFPIKSDWDFVMRHLEGTWGITFPNCIVLAAHPNGEIFRLRRTLHHEANHSIRLKFIEDDHCFLDRIILEGLAEVYVDEKFPTEPSSKYVLKTSKEEFKAWIPKLKEFWLNKNFLFDDYKSYLYGSEELKIPQWLGYAVGFHIVKDARINKFSKLTWTDLIQVPATEFI